MRSIAGFLLSASRTSSSAASPCLWVRGVADDGLGLLIYLLFAVWATDIGAYAAGRAIGGPKLAPRISPKKTWAGLIGGMISAAVFGTGVALAFGAARPGLAALLAAVLAVVSQAGDLFRVGHQAPLRCEGQWPSHPRTWRFARPRGRAYCRSAGFRAVSRVPGESSRMVVATARNSSPSDSPRHVTVLGSTGSTAATRWN